jgi:ABC-2 type transport system ATP-binding protein
MSISIQYITKKYGSQLALNDVSFDVKKGEIVGFLGPNGAGKSTLMKIICSYIPPTSGKANICGFDVENQSIEVRKRIGYLAENNPLYYDMYVKEFLEFALGLRKWKGDKRKRVAEMIDMVGLQVEQNKKIGALSKGYKQRVGLAQAIIHNPEVLILDEPTTGLDPNQLVEIRNLIKELGKEKTVMFSTHILQEVEAVCDRIIIINKGNIVADNDATKIRSEFKNKSILTVEFDKKADINVLEKIQGVLKVNHSSGNHYLIEYDSKVDLRVEIAKYAAANGLLTLQMNVQASNLENIFKDLTSA